MGWVQKLFLYNIFFLFFYLPLVAHTPVWVSSYGITSSYPDQTHISGFGMAQVTKDTPVIKSIAMAESFARADLSQKVIVQVNSTINSFEDETNGSYSSQFSLQSESTSSLELVALQSEHHITANMVYVLSSVKKNLLKEPFQRVQTKEIDGIPYLAEGLNEFLSNTRRFKIKKQEAQQAEEILTITTMAGNK